MKYYIIPKEDKEIYTMTVDSKTKVIPFEIENGDYVLPESVSDINGYNKDLSGLSLVDESEIIFKNYTY